MNFLDFYNNFNYEDFLLLFVVYNFIKLLVICLFNEILWLTHFFNKKNSIKYQNIRIRFYSENLLKVRFSKNYSIFHFFFLKLINK